MTKFLKYFLLLTIGMMASKNLGAQNVLVIGRDTFQRALTIHLTALEVKSVRIALPELNKKMSIYGAHFTIGAKQSGKTINPQDTSCRISYDQFAFRFWLRKGGPVFPKGAPEIIYIEIPGEDCIDTIKVPVKEYVDKIIKIGSIPKDSSAANNAGGIVIKNVAFTDWSAGFFFQTSNTWYHAKDTSQLLLQKTPVLFAGGRVMAAKRRPVYKIVCLDCYDKTPDETELYLETDIYARLAFGNQGAAVMPYFGLATSFNWQQSTSWMGRSQAELGLLLGNKNLAVNRGPQGHVALTYGGDYSLTGRKDLNTKPNLGFEAGLQYAFTGKQIGNATKKTGQGFSKAGRVIWKKAILPVSKSTWKGLKNFSKWTAKKVKKIFTKKKKEPEVVPELPK